MIFRAFFASALKANISAELKKVELGERITATDHKRPVAAYRCPELVPLIDADPLQYLEEERGDR